MSDLSQTIKAGTLLIIETGEYSDRDWQSPVRVLKDFVKFDVAEEFKALPRSRRRSPGPADFLPWLITAGYVEAVDDVTSWHVGCYSQFEP
jgi:hypothetical protein